MTKTKLKYPRTYAIGDIHGCHDQFLKALSWFADDAGGSESKVDQVSLVLIGDYIDRGPNSKRVVDFIMDMQQKCKFHFYPLAGNHEHMMIDAYSNPLKDHSVWLGNGGVQTLQSFGANTVWDIDAKYIDWMRNLPIRAESPHQIFVHGGLQPGVAIEDQTVAMQLWYRYPRGGKETNWGKTVVHGHTPTRDKKPYVHPWRVNIDTGAVFGGPLTVARWIGDDTTPHFEVFK